MMINKWVLKGNILLLFLFLGCFTYLHAQNHSIKGKVTDVGNEPLIGVNVVEQGTTNGTVTDINGGFSLTVKENATIQFSYIGYQTLDVNLKGESTLNVVLHEDSELLKEVVVVGYGKTSSKDLTSSITSLTAKELNKGPVTSVAQMLQGRVSGVYISKDGDPNSPGSLIIRGTSTLREGAQSPLYVIDGVPTAGVIIPEDIVSIDILKDASATSIYGSRAANGVIMITTRQGTGGESRYTTFNSYMNVEHVSKRYEMMSGDEYRKYLTENGSSIEPGWDDNVNTDWQKELMRTAISENVYFNTGGSINKASYDASVNIINTEGIIKSTGNKKVTFRNNIEQPFLNDKVTIGVSLNGSINRQDLLVSPGRVYKSMLTFVPTTTGIKSDGTYIEDLARRDHNPIALIAQNTGKGTNKIIFGSVHGKWEVLPKDLFLNASISYQNSQSNMDIYMGKESTLATGKNGEAIRNAYEGTETIFETYLNYDKRITDHRFGAMLGYSWQETTQGNGFQTSNVNFMSDATSFYNVGLGSGAPGYVVNYGNTNIRTLRMISFFGRVNYNYKDKYILQASLREDGSSAFGVNNRWGLFPSLSGAWRIIAEPFMSNQTIFDDLKLKVGYGISGNSIGFDPLISQVLYGPIGKSYYQGNYINSIGAIQNENPNLKWEKTSMLNVGLTAALLNSRLRMEVEWYNKLTSDLIWSYSVPNTKYLYETLLANVGEVSNKGIELTASYDVLRNTPFTWTSGVTMAHNRNMVESLSDDMFRLDYARTAGFATGAGQSGATAQIIQEGQPIGTFYTLKFKGFEDGKSIFINKDGEPTDAPVAPDDYYIVGNAQPKLYYSWMNSLTWRNLTLDLLFRGVHGHNVLNSTLAMLNYTSRVSHYNQPRYTIESGQPFNDIRSHFTSDRYIERADFFRLENINLSYRIPFSNKYLKDITAYVNVNNAFVFTSYKGIDPEVSMAGITPGIDSNNFYPKTRSYQLGVKINF